MKSLLLFLAATAAATCAPWQVDAIWSDFHELLVDGSCSLIRVYLAAKVVIPDPPR